MANFRKSFNFRNGVQVDDDNLVVNSNGLVGIGTSVPSEILDVRGTAKIVGLVTATEVFAQNTVTSGVSTFSGGLRVGIVSVGQNGIVTATSGIVTYFGDARFLQGMPTSQWVDIDAGLGYTSIYAAGNVGVATVDPRFTFQVGGNTSTSVSGFSAGVGINSRGSILATGIITATTFVGAFTGNITGDVNSSGVGTFNSLKVGIGVTIGSGVVTATTFRGNLIGDVTGTASTAQNLTGTPNITVNNITASNYNSTGILTAFRINSGFSTTGISTVHNLLHISALGSIGVGTDSPNADIHIRDANDGASLQLTSDGANVSYISIGSSVTRTGNNSELRFGNTNVSQQYSTSSSVDVINYGLGNLNNYLHLGSIVGLGTGNFNWIYGKSTNSPLMTLTYGGRLGLGVTNPTTTLHVVGTSTVTGNSFIDGSSFIVGNLTVQGNINGTVALPSLFNGNVNSTGISTFNQIRVSGMSTFVSALNLLGNVGVGTTASTILPFRVNGPTLSDQFVINTQGSIGIGTNSINLAPSNQYRVSIDAARGVAYLLGVGVGTLTPNCFADFSRAGQDIPDFGGAGIPGSQFQFMLPPKVTTTVRNNLSAVEGAFIYNTTNRRLEIYNGDGWSGISTIP